MLSSPCDTNDGSPVTVTPRCASAWRDVELLLLVLLVLGVYFSRLTALSIRGEEPRWATVAQEMIDRGDYVVPRQQGQPFPDRPPLNSWAMIAASRLTGELNLASIRLPSVLATLFTTVLIYVYARQYLSHLGATAAACAFATMGQVLHLGRMAESDALLTLCLAAALFAWHYAYDRRHDPRLAWLGGYALAALAALDKGPQGPVYFVAITGVFLALRRDWRFLLCRWHAAGVALFVTLVGAWNVPFALALEPAAAWRVWSEEGNLAARFQPTDLARAFRHWVSFPLEVFGSMLPWSFLLAALPTRWFRQNVGAARPLVALAVTACAVAFPTCWLPIDSRPRYFLSLCPCVALLVGLLIQRSWEAQQFGWWRRSWDRFLVTGEGLILAAPLALTGLWLFAPAALYGLGHSLSGGFLACYGVAALAAVAVAQGSRVRHRPRWASGGVLALAGFLGLSYTVVVIDMQVRTSNDPSPAVASVRALVPPDERLVSYGHVHHLFAYYYQEPIEFQPLRKHMAPAEGSETYFCFTVDPGFVTAKIPFAWERVAEISCERARSPKPQAKVVVGRRLPQVADARAARPPQSDDPSEPSDRSSPVEPASFTSPASGD